ncbi:AAA family ATPase [Paenibacillaceae bacterium WGS1546]|uniref:AAA family ATPase n=1 Tax=Cohnella sp. WGS1546 TaxID=3366810 RepID=UPI00372D130E
MAHRTIYLVSGSAGAGKSTTSRRIASRLERSAHIEGDLIDHMVIGGHEKPWLSRFHSDLIWRNLLALARNYVEHGHDVVVDYVAFPRNAEAFAEAFRGQDVTVKYVVLLVTDEDELLRRDAQRESRYRMGRRCIEGMKEIVASRPKERHVLNTSALAVDAVVLDIRGNDRYIVEAEGDS